MKIQQNLISRIMPSFMDIEFLVHLDAAQDPEFPKHLGRVLETISEYAEVASSNKQERDFIQHETVFIVLNLSMPHATQEERMTAFKNATQTKS